MNKRKLYFKKIWLIILFGALAGIIMAQLAYPQGAGEVRKWLRVGMLRAYFSNYGAEYESGGLNTDPTLMWPAQFLWQGCSQAKSMWIGCTNYADRNGTTYPYKVIVVGPRGYDPLYQFISVEFRLTGKSNHPMVYVDGILATDNDLNDVLDEVSDDLKPDRTIINRLNTYLGVTVTRKIMAFSQQYHDNYYIYDYVFKNTGIVDRQGNTDPKTLEGVYFHFQYRYASGFEANQRAWAPMAGVRWGRNTINDVVWADPANPAIPMRAQVSWYGPCSVARVDDWGCPNPRDGRLAGVHYMGNIVLHADKSASDKSDDLEQPRTTWYVPSDMRPAEYGSDQFSVTEMEARYLVMSEGHAPKTHAQEVGDGYADIWRGSQGVPDGGYSQGQGFGPYTLALGDSIHIVIAEAIAGISREKSIEVGKNWYLYYSGLGQPDLILPNGSPTTDENEYKKLWVQTGKDSIFETFRHAMRCYQNNYIIPQPPPPPEQFEVASGGDRIRLTWSENADSWPHFDGYEIYRATGRPDTLYDRIFSCNKSDVVHTFDDVTARRGFDYYYYIVSKDDGTTNDIQSGVPLVSSRFYTMTNKPANLQRPAGQALSKIRVVPNPYHIRAREYQFGNVAPDRLAFFGLPPECTIKIFTESGELIETIDHNNTTGDEYWHSVTSSNQVVVSGVYIAYFEIPRDYYDPTTGMLLFRKGESTYRKFIIIR